ncbi:MAG TPA: hypothetical protein VFD92_22990 [Candidatus Binatia bacterium]|nr:hypothetical protein [Candidatus Binatia bacterium]
MVVSGRRQSPVATCARLLGALLAANAVACSDAPTRSAPSQLRAETTRLCALVPARDPAAAAFPPAPPAKVFGTDLGFTYEANGRVPILFGDSWQRIDICPIQVNDDSLGTLALPAEGWPGFTARQPIPDAECPAIDFEVDAAGTSFAPIVLTRWDGVAVPLGPLNTPVAGFFDGQSEWAIFIVGGGQTCSAAESASGAACPSELSPQAAGLVCGTAAGESLCVDPTSTRRGDGAQAFYLHVAERVGPAAYVSRAMFLTNKYLNATVRTVRAFDARDPRRRDYAPGFGALLLWGRPGFDDLSGAGEEPPYLLVHPLPFARDGERIAFAPQYFTGVSTSGDPLFASSQRDAVPLYTGEMEPVNQAAVSWVAPIGRWLTIYGGGTVDFGDPEGRSGRGQPVRGAMVARVAPEAWGPWSDPVPVLTEEQATPDFVCGKRAPAGCLPPPDPLIRPACIEAVDRRGGGTLYGANLIDALTRPGRAADGRASGADVFWDYSTWHPYGVSLARTHVEIE